MNMKEAIDKTLPGSEISYEGAIYLLQNIQKKELNYESQGIFWAIELLKRSKKLEGDLIEFLEKENPYPEDVFLPIEKEDFDRINDLLKKEMGYSIDRLSGNMGRKLYKSIIEALREVIK